MFQPAISAGVAARPMAYGLCACDGPAQASSHRANTAMQALRIVIAHLAIGSNAPGPDRVVVIEIALAADREKFGQRRLDVTGFIDRAALNDGRLAVPMPREPEPGQRPRQHGLLQLRLLPALAIIDGDIDAFDLAAAAPG